MSSARARGGLWVLVGVSIAVALVANAWFVARTVFVRVPYWGEAEVLFEADRLARHLPLFVDPLVGADDYGRLPPSRFFVTYPPLWSWVLARLPVSYPGSAILARVACTVSWFGSLAALAWHARDGARRAAACAAAFVAGIWVLSNFATTGQPDSIAIAVATLALLRVVRSGAVDAVSIALLVLVPWIKPTIVGLPAGLIVGGALAERGRALAAAELHPSRALLASRPLRILGLAAVLAAVGVPIAHVASSGQLFAHVVQSNAQPFSAHVWLEQVPARLPFFGPLFGWAGWLAYRDRREPRTRILACGLIGALGWTLIALAKTGSASNYWMEPCIAAVAVVASAKARAGTSAVQPAAALVAVLWADTASVRAALEHTRSERAIASFVASVRSRCGVPEDSVVAADEAGIELAANGRILVPTYQMVHLARRGRFPASVWVDDLSESACFVEHTGQLRLAAEIHEGLEQRFVPLERDPATGIRLWRRR